MTISYVAGLETAVNTTVANDQTLPSVTGLPGGGYVVAWASNGQDGSNAGIYMQRYDASGAAQGAETLVNTTTVNSQSEPSVTGLPGGGYVVTWASLNQDGSGYGVYMQRYDASGVAQGNETLVNTTTGSSQYQPSVTSLPGGGYVVTWTSNNQDGDSSGVYMQRYNASGVAQGNETLVNTTTATDQNQPSVTGLPGGGYVVTWASLSQDGDGSGIYMQRYDASGVAQGNETLVNTTTLNWQYRPSVTALSGGGYVVSWASLNQDGDSFGVYLQRYNASGVAQGPETLVNTTTVDTQSEPSVTGLPGGGYVVTWTSSNQDGGGNGIYQRLYTAVDSVITVPSTTDFTGQTLTNKDGITFAGAATATFTAAQFGPGLILDTVAVIGDGNANALVVNMTAAGSFSAAGWTFANWTDGADTITLNGSSGADAITGSSRNDVLTGGNGADLISGGAGTDVANYFNDGGTAGVYVALNSNIAIDGFGAVDSLSGIEVVFGTNNIYSGQPAWSDYIIGSAANETFYGFGGNDYLDMGAGNDVAAGGDGNDYIFGGDGNDSLYGEAGVDYITGDNGADVMAGGAGADYLLGNAGNDTIYGEAGNDFIIAGAGSDHLVGGADQDYFYNMTVADYVAGDFDTFADLAADDYIYMPLALQGATNVIDYNGGALIYTAVAGGNWYGFVAGQSVAFTQAHIIFA